MEKALAQLLTTALVQFVDREQPKDKMGISSIEAEELERVFTEEKFDRIEDWYAHRMKPELTEFESRVKFVMSECSANLHDAEDIKDVKDTAIELLEFAKKELARRDEVITLDNLQPYDKGFQDGKAEAMADLERTYFCNPDKLPKWLKDDIARRELNAHTKGYNMGYKDAEQWYNNWVAARFPIMPTPPSGWGCDGTHCTNPHHDCINCPVKYSSGGTITTPNTASGTSTLKAEG